MGEEGEPPDRDRRNSKYNYQYIADQLHKWYSNNGKNWVEPRQKSVLEIVEQEIEQRVLDREWKARQLRWQRRVSPPKETEFCPIIHSCYSDKKADTNCFLTKAPGCPNFVDYLNEINEGVEITRENCLQYVPREEKCLEYAIS